MSDTKKDENDKDESLADTTMSLNIADFQKRYSELMEASDSSDEAPVDDEAPAEQTSGG